MSPRIDRFVRILLIIAGALVIAFAGRWLFSTFVEGGMSANLIFLFLLVAGGLAMFELMDRRGDDIMIRLFHRRKGQGDGPP